MSNVPGVFSSIDNTLVSAPAPLGQAVFMMGHLTASPAGWTKAAAGVPPTVKAFTSYGAWVAELGGALATDGWVAGEENGVAVNVTPNDPTDSLLRGLALLYAAAPSAKVYVAIIDSTITDETAAPAGMADALAEALKYNDIAYVVAPGYNPLTEIEAHCAAAASVANPYNSPRTYLTGIDMFSVWDTEAGHGSDGAPLDATGDILATFANKSATGNTVAYIGNHMYNFAAIFTSTVSSADVYAGAVEIGGQYVAAYLAGLMASKAPSFTMTNHPQGLGATVYDGLTYIFSVTEVDEALGDDWVITRYLNNNYVLAKGVTHTSDLSWRLLPHREVTNYVHKNLARTVQQFIGRQLTAQTIGAVSNLANKFLGTAISAGYISSGSATAKQHATEVDAITIEAQFVTVKPINRIYLNFSVS